MNRKEAEDFVYKSYEKASAYQDYQEKDSGKRRPDLTRKIIEKKAGTPCTLVTGSKGKGSVANMISQILQTEYKVGLMTSPHLISFCERFKINGTDISDEDFTLYMNEIHDEIEEIDRSIPNDVCISPMGIQADLALTYFNAVKTDFNIFEGGKGAKFDDVNNIKHDYAVINTIFLEHTRELGNTVEEIARDKAYVITGEQKCVYIAPQQPDVMEVIKERAIKKKVPLKIYGRDFGAENIRFSNNGMLFDINIKGKIYSDLRIPLLGEHQARNCALAMALCQDVLGELQMNDVRKKLSELFWPGRMQVLSAQPFIMLDACINSASCGNVKEVLKALNIERITAVIGIPDDKDYAGVVKEMAPISDKIILTKSGNLHYIFTSKQQERLKEENIITVWTDSVTQAFAEAQKYRQPTVILGTTSLISEVTLCWRKKNGSL